MENEQNQIPQYSIPQPDHKFHIKRWEIVTVCIVVLALSVYAVFASNYNIWPFKVSVAPVLSPTLSPTATPDPLADWQTYRNEEYGFEFKYPDNIDVELTSSGVIQIIRIEDKNKDMMKSGIWIYIKDNPEELSASAWWDKYGIDSKTDMKLERSYTEIGDYNSLVIHGSEGLLENHNLISHDGKIIDLTIMGGLEEEDQILSTFRFIESGVYRYKLKSLSGFGTDDWWDGQLIQINTSTGEEKILVSSIKNALPELKDTFNLALRKLSFPPGNRLYFVKILDGTDAPPIGLYVFDILSNKFSRMASSPYYSWFAPKAISPDDKLVATLDDPDENTKYIKLFLIDLERDTVKTIVSLSGVESFNRCVEDCFGGVDGELKWINNETVEYSVYDLSKTEKDQWGGLSHPLIAKRKVTIN